MTLTEHEAQRIIDFIDLVLRQSDQVAEVKKENEGEEHLHSIMYGFLQGRMWNLEMDARSIKNTILEAK